MKCSPERLSSGTQTIRFPAPPKTPNTIQHHAASRGVTRHHAAPPKATRHQPSPCGNDASTNWHQIRRPQTHGHKHAPANPWPRTHTHTHTASHYSPNHCSPANCLPRNCMPGEPPVPPHPIRRPAHQTGCLLSPGQRDRVSWSLRAAKRRVFRLIGAQECWQGWVLK